MEEFRSSYRSYQGGGRKLEIVKGKAFSVNQLYTSQPRSAYPPRAFKVIKTRSSSSSSSSSASKSWFNDPEMKRRKRVAKYKLYAVEGKVKSSLKKGFRWFKNKCSKIVRGL